MKPSIWPIMSIVAIATSCATHRTEPKTAPLYSSYQTFAQESKVQQDLDFHIAKAEELFKESEKSAPEDLQLNLVPKGGKKDILVCGQGQVLLAIAFGGVMGCWGMYSKRMKYITRTAVGLGAAGEAGVSYVRYYEFPVSKQAYSLREVSVVVLAGGEVLWGQSNTYGRAFIIGPSVGFSLGSGRNRVTIFNRPPKVQ